MMGESYCGFRVRAMVLNATFNNISVVRTYIVDVSFIGG
jgi:hypothetical protein